MAVRAGRTNKSLVWATGRSGSIATESHRRTTIVARRQAGICLEAAAKATVDGQAGHQSDLSDGVFGFSQKPARPGDTSASDKPLRGFPIGRFE